MNATTEQNSRLKPAQNCVICNKFLQLIGGRRLIAQQLRGIILSKKYQGGGNKDYPHQSFKLSEDSDDYVVVWGKKSFWTKAAITQAIKDFQNDMRPWFCQKCGVRQCSACGEPINYPMGSDALSDDGCTSHIPIFPYDPGCINKKCEKYKEWGKK